MRAYPPPTPYYPIDRTPKCEHNYGSDWVCIYCGLDIGTDDNDEYYDQTDIDDE